MIPIAPASSSRAICPFSSLGAPGTGLLAAAEIAPAPRAPGTGPPPPSEGRPVIATLAPPDAAELYKNDPVYAVTDLRSIAMQGMVPVEELGILAMAKSLLDWHRRHRFCANCGSPTALAQAGFRRDCPACATQDFPHRPCRDQHDHPQDCRRSGGRRGL